MDSVSRYGFINAKLRARIGAMHSSDVMDRMIKAPSLVESISLLKGTNHESLAEVYDKTGDLQMVELELFSEEIGVHRDVISYLDKNTSEFVSILLERVEVENVKNALRLWYSAGILHHQISYRAGYIYKEKIVHNINYTKVVNSLSYKDVLSAFSSTPYYDVLSRFSEEGISRDGLFEVELALDHLWYDRLYASFSSLSKADRAVAEKIYNVDVDLKNVLYLIRYGFYHKVTGERMSKAFVPYSRIYSLLKNKIASGSVSFEEAKKIIKKVYPSFGELFGELENKGELSNSHTELAYGTLKLENYLGERRKKEFVSILSGDPFTIGTLLAYIFLYKNECHMIRGILSAKYYGWDEDQIRRELN